jgi:hypothetical protein
MKTLKSISEIVPSPGYDTKKALKEQKNLQQYITENYYTCTKEILAGLGQNKREATVESQGTTPWLFFSARRLGCGGFLYAIGKYV